MDQIIQSLVQSPYVRAMSALPTKSEELVHGVDDFIPPLSRRKVIINPSSGRLSRDVYRFDIPRLEHLDGLELVVRARDPHTGNIDILGFNTDGTLNLQEPLSSSKNRFAVLDDKNIGMNQLESIELYAKNRLIEQLDPNAIAHEMMVQQTQDVYSKWLYNFGYSVYEQNALTGEMSTSNTVPFPMKTRRLAVDSVMRVPVTLLELRTAQWHIPLPFCSLSMIKKNFQSSFLETMSVNVSTRFCPFFQTSSASGYDMVLIASYHQYHPSVESVIRNANYKSGIPATLPWWEWMPLGNEMQSTAQSKVYELNSDALVSELLVVPRLYDATTGLFSFSWSAMNFFFRLTSNGELLMEADANSLLEDRQRVIESDKHGVCREIMNRGAIPIRFGLRYGETFTGGISLASLNAVSLAIYPTQRVLSGSADSFIFGNYEVQFQILAKRHYMVRIDSDTGVVSRSIES